MTTRQTLPSAPTLRAKQAFVEEKNRSGPGAVHQRVPAGLSAPTPTTTRSVQDSTRHQEQPSQVLADATAKSLAEPTARKTSVLVALSAGLGRTEQLQVTTPRKCATELQTVHGKAIPASADFMEKPENHLKKQENTLVSVQQIPINVNPERLAALKVQSSAPNLRNSAARVQRNVDPQRAKLTLGHHHIPAVIMVGLILQRSVQNMVAPGQVQPATAPEPAIPQVIRPAVNLRPRDVGVALGIGAHALVSLLRVARRVLHGPVAIVCKTVVLRGLGLLVQAPTPRHQLTASLQAPTHLRPIHNPHREPIPLPPVKLILPPLTLEAILHLQVANQAAAIRLPQAETPEEVTLPRPENLAVYTEPEPKEVGCETSSSVSSENS